jgi:hypothetical protein
MKYPWHLTLKACTQRSLTDRFRLCWALFLPISTTHVFSLTASEKDQSWFYRTPASCVGILALVISSIPHQGLRALFWLGFPYQFAVTLSYVPADAELCYPLIIVLVLFSVFKHCLQRRFALFMCSTYQIYVRLTP